MGNRMSSAHQPGVWGYNQDNQLIQYPKTTPFSANPPKETQVSYTPQGHTKKEKDSQGERTYIYNAAERLVEVRQDGRQKITYRYDPMGRRISKTVGSLSRANYYLYSDNALVAEANRDGRIIRTYGWNTETDWKGLWSADPVWQAQTDSGSLNVAMIEYNICILITCIRRYWQQMDKET